MHGWLNIYKPLGMNSTKVVTIVRRALDNIKVGHGGTLDPMAEGILPLALGDATKTMSYLMDKIKVYEFEITWGSQTSTDDAQGDTIAVSDFRPSQEQITEALPSFTGQIEQIPPDYSAVWVDGKRAYSLARKDVELDLKARTIFVEDFRLLSAESNDRAVFQVTCGKGTYIRSLARDLALHLGTRGHISILKRVKVGKFSITNAISLENFQELGHKVLAEGYVYPIADVLDDIPAVCVTADQEIDLWHGRTISLSPQQAEGLLPGKVLCIQVQGKALAIGSFDSGFVQPNRVFNKN
jgi:tRNA pseudouridine55 synthase